MPRVEGQTLASLLSDPSTGRLTALPVHRCLEIFVKVCETLAYAHDRGVVHLDLKPANVMVGRYGQVFIMDWGNAFVYDPGPYRAYLETHVQKPQLLTLPSETGIFVLGTPLNMAPEQFSAPRTHSTPAADVFAAGIILYQMLVGTNPFVAKDLAGIRQAIEEIVPPPAHSVNADIPKRLSEICERALEKSSANRYRNCGEMLADLKRFQDTGEAFVKKSYQSGELIFEEGASGEYAFIILSGRVEVAKQHGHERKVLAVLGPNEIVGELALFTGEPRVAEARALEPTVIRIMSKEDVLRELDKLSPWVGKMITSLAHRFVNLNEKLLERGTVPS
jgi:eukaryotic-like serine/threonine-protein kinase